MHKFLAYQIRVCTDPAGNLDVNALIEILSRTYEEFDRERRLNDRAAKLMEEELQAANQRIKRTGELRLTETLDGAPSAITLLDADLAVQNINPAMLALCGGPAAVSHFGVPFADFLGRTGLDGRAIAERLLTGETVEIDVCGRWYLGSARRLSDGCHAVAFSEVTALKQREEALAIAKDAAESANRLKSQFLAVMSHELRTPLNAILGFSEVVRDTTLGSSEASWRRYSEYAGSIHDSGQHLLALISDILDLSKIESGSYELDREPLDLVCTIDASVALLRPQTEKGQVSLIRAEPQGPLWVQADHRAMKQVVVNLLSNAVKFTPAGGKIWIDAVGNDRDIVLSVRDTGIGIASEHLKSVFDAFHQANARVSRRYEGTGLGLSIIRRLVEMHGGSATLESELGIGTLAVVRIPRDLSLVHCETAAA